MSVLRTSDLGWGNDAVGVARRTPISTCLRQGPAVRLPDNQRTLLFVEPATGEEKKP